MPKSKPIIIGVGGYARAGKDTFVKIAIKILKENGYNPIRLAFADQLKYEIDPFLKQFYGISAWTDKSEEKLIIRPLLVAHGCQKRIQTDGKYWVDTIDKKIEHETFTSDVVLVSDCRFPNEVDWVHNKWGGWFVHLKKYSMVKIPILKDNGSHGQKLEVKDDWCMFFDKAPNSEEAENDPICEKKSDYNLSLENTIERELRLNNIKITPDSLIDNTYLNKEIKLCLTKCPFLTIK